MLIGMLLSGFAVADSGTSMIEIDDILETVKDIGSLLGGVADIIPDVTKLAVAVAMMLFVLGVIGAILVFIRGALKFRNV
jgi:hypothetical protein